MFEENKSLTKQTTGTTSFFLELLNSSISHVFSVFSHLLSVLFITVLPLICLDLMKEVVFFRFWLLHIFKPDVSWMEQLVQTFHAMKHCYSQFKYVKHRLKCTHPQVSTCLPSGKQCILYTYIVVFTHGSDGLYVNTRCGGARCISYIALIAVKSLPTGFP